MRHEPANLWTMQVTKRRRSRKQLQVEDATQHALADSVLPEAISSSPTASNRASTLPSDAPATSQLLNDADVSTAAQPKVAKRKRTASVKSKESNASDIVADAGEPMPIVTPKRRQASKKGKPASAEEAEATPAEAVAAAVEAVTSDDGGNKKVKRQRVKASEVAVDTQVELLDTPVKGN